MGPQEMLNVTASLLYQQLEHYSHKTIVKGGRHTRFKKYHRQRRNRRRRQPPPIDARRIPLREHADDEHVGAHEERAREQRPAAADALDEEEQEKGAADDLADAKEAAEQEGVLAGADGLEDLGGDCGVSARISYPMG